MPALRDFPRSRSIAPFESRNSEVIRSIQQRDLLNKWLSLYTGLKRPPAFADYDPGLPDRDRLKLVYYSVSFKQDQLSIVIDSYGSNLAEAYGRTGLGQELSEYLGPGLAPLIVPIYEECIRQQLPVYTISRVEDHDSRQVDLERMLLPFSDGKEITNIIGSFEAISMDGYFQLERLMADHLPVDVLRAVIDKDLSFSPPPRISSHDKIEFE